MTLLPFETFVIESGLNKQQTVIELMNNIEPEKIIRFWNKSDTKEFEGHLRGNEFEIKRIISYKNSFLPIIKGRIETFGDKARLTINMRAHIFVIIFMLVWFGFVGLFLLAALIGGTNSSSIESILIPCGMLVFGYVLTMGGYLFEASKAKDLLLDITNGRVVPTSR